MDNKLADLLVERLAGTYDPWRDLMSKTGVDVRWSSTGDMHGFRAVLGVTDFNDLSVTLRLGMGEGQLRSTVAHEALHLDRGPLLNQRSDREQALEERRINLIVAKRLVDPVLFDHLLDLVPRIPDATLASVLRVDRFTFRTYATWYCKTKKATRDRAWEEAKSTKAAWPPAWLTDGRWGDSVTEAANWAGIQPSAAPEVEVAAQ